jgi:DNA ligase 1
MELARLVAAADQVAATSSRSAKRDVLGALLGAMAPAEIEAGVGFLVGEPRQGRVGVGWATVADAVSSASPGADGPGLEVLDLDRALDRLEASHGPGSVRARGQILGDLFARSTPAEADFMRRLLVGELRQGALEGVMADAVAVAAQVPATLVRRATMLSGDLRFAARVALTAGRAGLEDVGLTLFRPVQPMLAATAEDLAGALGDGEPASVEWKLDGARIQVHRQGDRVEVYTRNLNVVTARLPEVVAVVRALPIDEVVLDGEVLGLEGERPEAFQETMSRFGRDDPEGHGMRLRPFFFDVLRAEGTDLIDRPLTERLDVLDAAAPGLVMPRLITAEPAQAEAFVTATLAAGHEGVMIKDASSAYVAGRRGKAWRKLKPVHTFDLVVLAVEWGHGRRRGWLSNLHLGARQPDGAGFVMVGKTFKGLTDALLRWQTEALLAREIGRDDHVVHVRPDLVVEVAIDGVQVSTRYPGGVALRFARVKQYRPDRSAADADTIDALRALLSG